MARWISSQPLYGSWGAIVAQPGEEIPAETATDDFLRGAVNQVELTPEEYQRIHGVPQPHGDVEQSTTATDHPDAGEQGEGERAD